MPVAVATQEYERRELKSLPDPDDPGYIMVRPLPYGSKLERREKAMRMSMESQPVNRKQRRGKEAPTGEADKMNVEFASRTTAEIDFAYCIGDHNLTDNEGRKLDLSNPRTLDFLDPKVGSEIENILSEINGDDLDEEVFTGPSETLP